ncbi:SRPBCC family protein [Formivibrio citricus]|nr:SRPBCC family protein [Formivibrio citricus]
MAVALDPVVVNVEDEADHVVLSASFSVPVPRDQAWAVMVDFENMPRFMPFLKSSRVLSRNGNTLRVLQTGTAPVVFLNISYESVREIDLQPFSEIRAHSVGGNAGMLKSVAKLTARDQRTEVSYRADWWPTSALAAGFGGNTMRDLLGKQFTAMRQEMIRRQPRL